MDQTSKETGQKPSPTKDQAAKPQEKAPPPNLPPSSMGDWAAI